MRCLYFRDLSVMLERSWKVKEPEDFNVHEKWLTLIFISTGRLEIPSKLRIIQT